MNFNQHYNLRDKHSFLSASKHTWIHYTVEKLRTSYKNFLAIQRGTKLHAFAEQCITLGQKLPRSKKTLNTYVNDAIGFRMTPEQPLYYSENCFGTADAICFDERTNFLRIHDLKTGLVPAHMDQLKIYAALFCLEYDYRPKEIDIELRIYQNSNVEVCNPDPDEITEIMATIVESDAVIEELKEEQMYD